MGSVPIPQGSQLEELKPVPIPSGTSLEPLQPENEQATISATPKPQGYRERFVQWLDDLKNDVMQGGDTTVPGAILKKMGAPGLEKGVSEGAAEYMGSPILGSIQATKGAAQLTQGKVLEGGGNVIGGAIKAAQIPASFIAPEAGEVAAATTGKLINKIPSAERAGQMFQDVKAVADKIPLDLAEPGNRALRIVKLAEQGGSRPKVINDFMKRVTDPEKGPLTYGEAREFYTNASRLSADEMKRLSPRMRFELGKFVQELNSSIASAAEQVGKRATFEKAMDEYRQAMKLNDVKEGLAEFGKKVAVKGAAGAVGGAAAGATGYELYRILRNE
jgi:hypothetical protein